MVNIPPYNGFASWESKTASEGAHNLWAMMEQYTQTVRSEAHAEPPASGIPSTIGMVVLEIRHHYQDEIQPRPLEQRWDSEALHSVLLRDMDLPDGPSPLLPGQPPDPLTAIFSGSAGTWHPGHTLYCLWRWAQRRWQPTKEWSATLSFHLDGRQETGVILPHNRANPLTRTTCAPSLRSIRSEHWRRDRCQPPSKRRRKDEQHMRPS